MKYIIDTDAGSDDAMAILLALSAQLFQIIAITCSYGNTLESNVETNVLKTLTIANRPDIPVYGGAKKPFIEDYEASDYFGNDGFGDFEFERDIISSVDRSKHASTAMVELAQKYAGDVSIITLGPLTNVALAASLDPDFTTNVNRFYVMGSKFNETELIPTSLFVEFNFNLDPQSNAALLKSTTKSKILIVPTDVTRKYSIEKVWRTKTLGELNSEKMNFLNKAEKNILKTNNRWRSADSVAMAVMLWPELITHSIDARMSAIVCGPFTGMVKVEIDGLRNEEKNVEIVRDFDVVGFQEKLIQYLA